MKMTEQYVVVTITEEVPTIPESWHRAEECRKVAESWENAEIKTCIDKVMNAIWEKAQQGGTSLAMDIYTTRPPHFYTTLKTKLEQLGYVVIPATKPWDAPSTYCKQKQWEFRW